MSPSFTADNHVNWEFFRNVKYMSLYWSIKASSDGTKCQLWNRPGRMQPSHAHVYWPKSQKDAEGNNRGRGWGYVCVCKWESKPYQWLKNLFLSLHPLLELYRDVLSRKGRNKKKKNICFFTSGFSLCHFSFLLSSWPLLIPHTAGHTLPKVNQVWMKPCRSCLSLSYYNTLHCKRLGPKSTVLVLGEKYIFIHVQPKLIRGLSKMKNNIAQNKEGGEMGWAWMHAELLPFSIYWSET